MPLAKSIPVENTMQILDSVEISPLISKCKVKVCYIGNNRNGSYISKELAEEMGRKLPGSPVVGFFNEKTKDFDEHSREISIRAGEFKIVDITRPYGFVPTDAEVWFQKFSENGIEREYLCTTCYIWTGAYPESQRIIDKGNNQSMELTNDQGFWADTDNPNKRIFIYNEALIEKLCILGEDIEPCFEGSQITSFSLDKKFQEFKATMISELQEVLNKGGSQQMGNTNTDPQVADTNAGSQTVPTTNGGVTINFQNPLPTYAVKPDEEEDAKKKKEEEEEKKKKGEYKLDEIPEYQELLKNYTALQEQFNTLQTEKTTLDTEVASLKEFKLGVERTQKEDMIKSFFMLSDEDKKEVTDNIDKFSLAEIEAKLSVACFRKKVNFNQEAPRAEANPSAPTGMFSLNNTDNNNIPAWILAVQQSNAQN